MVARKIQERRGGGSETVRDALQLKGTGLHNEQIGVVSAADVEHGVAEGVADVSGGFRADSVGAEQRGCQFGRGGFSVGSGDGDISAGQGAAGEFQFTDHGCSGVPRRLCHCGVNGDSGADDRILRFRKRAALFPVKDGTSVPVIAFAVDGDRIHAEFAGEARRRLAADAESEDQNIVLHDEVSLTVFLQKCNLHRFLAF